MSKSKKSAARKVLTGQSRIAAENAAEGFFTLCRQYQRLGSLLALQSKTLSHPHFARTPAPTVHLRLAEQYQEIGEQLKEIGTQLDALLDRQGTVSFPHLQLKRSPRETPMTEQELDAVLERMSPPPSTQPNPTSSEDEDKTQPRRREQ